jgi:protein-disulfide isomerase
MVEMTEWAPRLVLPVSEERDHILGPRSAPATLVEYGDYECPFCRAAFPIVEEIRGAMGPRIRFVYRHFPVTTVHPNAYNAAQAAEAAGGQGRFWQMHSMLFENQRWLRPDDLLVYADILGLDLVRFADDLAMHRHAQRVREDFMSGVRSGVNGTPTFFVNGVRHDAGWDFPRLMDALERAAESNRAA